MIYDLPYIIKFRRPCGVCGCTLDHDVHVDRIEINSAGYLSFILVDSDERIDADDFRVFDPRKWDPDGLAHRHDWYTKPDAMARCVRFLLDWNYPHANVIHFVGRPFEECHRRYYIAGLVEDALKTDHDWSERTMSHCDLEPIEEECVS